MENSTDFYHNEHEPPQPKVTPIADIISLETVVNMLVQKGVCTAEELYEEERRHREISRQLGKIRIVQTPIDPEQLQREELRKKQNWLKRKMSKHRWSRQLGTKVFGWQWKKVRVAPHVDKTNLH